MILFKNYRKERCRGCLYYRPGGIFHGCARTSMRLASDTYEVVKPLPLICTKKHIKRGWL